MIVASAPANQELQFDEMPVLNHYEAASQITGTYDGELVKGHCYVELLSTRPWSEVQETLH